MQSRENMRHVSFMRLFALGLIQAMTTGALEASVNNRPIIGILTQEVVDKPLMRYGKTFIPAAYVKYVESGGSRVMPIRLNQTLPEYEKIFKSINGMLYIGGAVNLETSDYARAARAFYRLAIEANDAGDYFPIWGTCLGFQLLTALAAGQNLLTNATAENLALPLNLTTDAFSSRMFEGFSDELLKALTQENLTGNFHRYGITEKDFRANEKLQKFFSILSTNVAENGAEFVSTMEGRKYPFYGVQWHPELNQFRWAPEKQFPHSKNAVQLTSLLSQFFINEARKSLHHFTTTEEESAALIYNYTPVNTASDCSYEQCYFF